MQTPLQMLIENLDREALDKTGFYDAGELEVMAKIKEHATKLLEKEKEIIMDAYWDGGEDQPITEYSCEQYFTKTFTDESK